MGFFDTVMAVAAPLPYLAMKTGQKTGEHASENLSKKADTDVKKKDLKDDPISFSVSQGWNESNGFEKAMVVGSPFIGIPFLGLKGMFA
jgi:hypothetical protein